MVALLICWSVINFFAQRKKHNIIKYEWQQIDVAYSPTKFFSYFINILEFNITDAFLDPVILYFFFDEEIRHFCSS